MKFILGTVLVILFIGAAAAFYEEDADWIMPIVARAAISRLRRDEVEELADAFQRNSFTFGGNLDRSGLGVNGQYTRSFNNGGSLNVGGNYHSSGQWGVTGGFDRTWNGGRTSVGINGGVSGGRGTPTNGQVGINFSHRWDDEDLADWLEIAKRSIETEDEELADWIMPIVARAAISRLRRRDEIEELADAFQRNSFTFGGNLDRSGLGVNGQYTRSFNNGGSLNVGGNYHSSGQWGVTGGFDRTWNGGRTSVGINGGVSGGRGTPTNGQVGVNFSHRWD